jgi:hypothetical protein
MNVSLPNRMKTLLQHRQGSDHRKNTSSPRKNVFRQNSPVKSIFRTRGEQPVLISPSITTSSCSNDNLEDNVEDNLEEIFRIEANKHKRQDEQEPFLIPSIIYAPPKGEMVLVDEDRVLLCRTDDSCYTDGYSLCLHEAQTDHNVYVLPVFIKIDSNYEDTVSIFTDEEDYHDHYVHCFEDHVEGIKDDLAESGVFEDESDVSTTYSYIQDYYDDYSFSIASFSVASFASFASF